MEIEKKVAETIKKYKLINKNEKVVVALSGGKDSTFTLYILHKLGYNVHGLTIDLHLGDWSKKNLENVKKFCKELGVGLTVVDLKKELGQGICFIKAVLKQKKGLTGCSVCGTVKKYILNKYAKKLKADKIATGHNLDDECQNVLMNFLKGNVFLGVNSAPSSGFGEKVKGFVQRIKPLFFIPEDEIRKFSKAKKFPVLYERCPCAFGTYRVDTRNWFESAKITDNEKLRIVENFQKIAVGLRNKNQKKLRFCRKCKEPSTGEVCSACKIFECF